MPRVLTADIVKAQARGIQAPTPVANTFKKGDAVITELYEVEYHKYAQALQAAGIWKQHWADAEHYKTGDQLVKEHKDDIALIRQLTHELERAQARVQALEGADAPQAIDPFTDLVERFDLVWQEYGFDPKEDGIKGMGLCRRDLQSDSKRLYLVVVNLPSCITGEGDAVACCYGPTAEEAICQAHNVLDLMLDAQAAKGKKRDKIIKQICEYVDDVDEEFETHDITS
jgi:hypothetical protein